MDVGTLNRFVILYAFQGPAGGRAVFSDKLAAALEANPSLRMGHAGIQLNLEGPICGFNPADFGEAVLRRVQWGGSTQGKVADDTLMFNQAQEAGLDVYHLRMPVIDAEYNTITANVEQALIQSESQTLQYEYQFPVLRHVSAGINCVQWIERMGVPIGRLKMPANFRYAGMNRFIRVLVQNGAVIWQP